MPSARSETASYQVSSSGGSPSRTSGSHSASEVQVTLGSVSEKRMKFLRDKQRKNYNRLEKLELNKGQKILVTRKYRKLKK